MNDSGVELRARMASAADLQSMARTMKTIAAANIGQYEAAVRALELYYGAVMDSLSACLRSAGAASSVAGGAQTGLAGAIVFGSDQGLVGQFNETVCARMLDGDGAPTRYKAVWPVGERVAAVLTERGVACGTSLPLPASIDAVTALVSRLLVEIESRSASDGLTRIDVFHHRPGAASNHAPVSQRLLPMDQGWERELAARPWPTGAIAQVLPDGDATLRACIREYLFVSLFRACAESLSSENAARLTAMQRAEKNIGERLQALTQTFHRQRQGVIDAELFDLVAGFEAQQSTTAGAKRGSTLNS